MENEGKINISEELDYLRSLMESLDSQLSVLVRGMDEIRKAYAVLKEEGLSASKDVRVSIGAGIFAKAKIDSKDKLFVPIGSDLYVEEDSIKSISRLDQNLKELDSSIQNVQGRRSEISSRYNSLVSVLQQAQEQQRSKN
ncbi:MAG: prefoldin subunit alpha [Candidatus Thermoplasmatota archaeon]|jgi:prefoldin alpha subunit|nr:prefoldin subunit alpha [Candidatus Thermoplasmatota archaeon]MCL5955700.1 prefoldin subunit alpha [Candidatus Thermoplasmatota archaeon]